MVSFFHIASSKQAFDKFRSNAFSTVRLEGLEREQAGFFRGIALRYIHGKNSVQRFLVGSFLRCRIAVAFLATGLFITAVLGCGAVLAVGVLSIGVSALTPDSTSSDMTYEGTAYDGYDDSLQPHEESRYAVSEQPSIETRPSYSPGYTGKQLGEFYSDSHTFFNSSNQVTVSGHNRGDTWVDSYSRSPPGGVSAVDNFDAHAKSAAATAAAIAIDYAIQKYNEK